MKYTCSGCVKRHLLMPCHKIVYVPAPSSHTSETPYTPYTPYNLLSFDFDDTLVPGIVHKSSFAIPIAEIVSAITAYVAKSKLPVVMCIFSNQYSLGKKKTTLECVTARFDAFIDTLKTFPVFNELYAVYVMFAPEKDNFRKPFTGMYTELCSELEPPTEKLYIGDAAGRQPAKGKRDFSCTDYHFANNCGMDFMTPEEFFLGAQTAQRCQIHKVPIIPDSPPSEYHSILTELILGMRMPHQRCSAIFLVGPPGVGKTTFAKKLEDTGLIKSFSLDVSGTFVRMRNAILQAKDSNIIIDNTNPCVASRARFLSLLKTTHDCIAVVFDLPADIATHTRMMRVAEGGKYIPDIAVRIFRTKFVAPEKSEGFQTVYTMSSIPDLKGNPHFQGEYLL